MRVDSVSRNPKRLRVLLQTKNIVVHNVSFRLGESHDAKIYDSVIVKRKMRVNVCAKTVVYTIVELYVSTKSEVYNVLYKMQRLMEVVASVWWWIFGMRSVKTSNISDSGYVMFLLISSCDRSCWQPVTLTHHISCAKHPFGCHFNVRVSKHLAISPYEQATFFLQPLMQEPM